MTSFKAVLLNVLLIWNTFTSISCQNYVYKCESQKSDSNYVCDANWGEFNIIEEFKNLSATLPTDGKALKRLEIHHSYIEEIPENVFLDISFTYIEIFEAQNLTRIHSNAFSTNMINNLRQQVYISGPSNLSNNPPDYDLYKALNSLVNIGSFDINLGTGLSHEIPDNAFVNSQNNLQFFSFENSDYTISRIGNYAFSGLTALSALSLAKIPIGKISTNSFDFNSTSNVRLTVNMVSCNISDETIENGAFGDAKRPLTIYLDSNPIHYIREEKFSKFLKSNQENIVQFYGDTLNCADLQPFVWLLQNKDQFKQQITGAVCTDGTPLWDLNYQPEVTTPTNYVYKCESQKSDSNYVCDANWGEFNLNAEIQRLSTTLPTDGKALKRLEIHHSYIEEIPENVFLDISFTYIEIFEAQNLTRIHSNAFSTNIMNNLRQQIYISGPSNLSNNPPDYDLYKALNSLVNIADVDINLGTGLSHEIPDNAFVNSQNSLQWFVFENSGYTISRIGNYAFSGLTALSALSFNRIPIGKISTNSFDFNSTSNERLTINMARCNISDETIENGAFGDAKRPLTIYLDSNPIHYIREEKFSKFLKSNPENIVQFYGDTLNCADLQPFGWLLQNKDQFKQQIPGAACTNGTSLWDLNYQPEVTTTPKYNFATQLNFSIIFLLSTCVMSLIVGSN